MYNDHCFITLIIAIMSNQSFYNYVLVYNIKEHSMYKNDPMRRTYWFFFICEGIVLISFLLQVILSIAEGSPNYFMGGYLIFFALLLIFAFFTFKRRHQRTEERRQRALSGDPTFLAQPQPQPDAQAQSLPAKIGLYLSIKRVFAFTVALFLPLVIIGIIAFTVIFQTGTPGNDTPSIVDPIMIGMMLAVLVFTFLVSFIVLLILRPLFEQEIVLDEQGVTTKFYRRTTRIPWNEVHSFAMWGNAKRFSTIQFEITSDHEVARWFQLGSPRKLLTWMTMLKPSLPYDEYRSEMAAIQQVIVARAGKPLYDLRDEKIVWW
jgi:hypothetical protein